MSRTLVLILLLFANSLYSQVKDECFYRCSRTVLRPGRATYYQSTKMNFYDLNHLTLKLQVQPLSKNIIAECFYKLKVLQPLDSFVIELKDNLQIDSVLVNGASRAFFRRDNLVYIPMETVVPAGEQMEVDFYYKGIVAAGFYTGTTPDGLSYTSSVSEAFQAREWFPAKQLLNDKIDTTDIYIITSAACKAGANGVLKEVLTLPDSRVQYHWRSTYPLNYYMPSISVANYREYNLYARPAGILPDSILIQNYISPSEAYFTANKPLIDKTPAYLEKMSQLFGLYPFYKEKYGHCQSQIGGGMEHATMTTLQTFEEHLVAHELGHQWFGDNVTCASWSDIWLNESFATYIQILMQEYLPALFTETASASLANLHEIAMSQPGGSIYVPESGAYDESRIFNYRLSYAKGATALNNLRFELQDDSLFFHILKTYQDQFGGSFASTRDFKLLVERLSNRDFSKFFDQKIYGEGYPTYSVEYLKKSGDSLVIAVTQTASMGAVTPFFEGLVPFKINSPAGDTTINLRQTRPQQTFTISYNKLPTSIKVDPDNWVLNRTGTIAAKVVASARLYPNPAGSRIYISVPVNLFQSGRLIDVNGRTLKSFSIAAGVGLVEESLGLPPGLYILQLVGSVSTEVHKLYVK